MLETITWNYTDLCELFNDLSQCTASAYKEMAPSLLKREGLGLWGMEVQSTQVSIKDIREKIKIKQVKIVE